MTFKTDYVRGRVAGEREILERIEQERKLLEKRLKEGGPAWR